MNIRTLARGLASLALGLIVTGLPQPTHAQSALCFSQTGQCISGRFRTYWEQNGGLPVFGFPISAARQEVNADTGQSYLTQSFERNRFELHPENATPYDVLLGRLGSDRLGQVGRDWQKEPRADGPKDGCMFFAQTGHNVCDQTPGVGGAQAGFLSYWRTNGLADPRLDAYGKSLALHGLPVTEARVETNANGDTVVAQWFERGRMEWHPSNPADFRVLLGLLGNETRDRVAPVAKPVKYLWPNQMPSGYVVVNNPQTAQTIASDTGFMLNIANYSSHGGTIQLTGGMHTTTLLPPGAGNAQAVTVRGKPGVAFTDGSTSRIYWSEDGQSYAVSSTGSYGLANLLPLTNALDTVSLSDWTNRVAQGSNQ